MGMMLSSSSSINPASSARACGSPGVDNVPVNAAALRLSRRAFRLVWWVVLVLMILNATFLFATSALYLSHHEGSVSLLPWLVSLYLDSKDQQFILHHQYHIAVGYVLPALPFAYCALTMVWASLVRKRLSFGVPPTRSKSSSLTGQRYSKWRRSAVNRLLQSITIRGQNFKWWLLVKETLEVVLQTIQACRMSVSISNRFVGPWCGVMILVNCASSLLVHTLIGRDPSCVLLGRLCCVLIDGVLDFLWGAVMQTYIAMPYLRMYIDWMADHNTPTLQLKSFETSAREISVIFVTSWQNYVLNTFMFVTAALVLHDMRTLLATVELTSSVHSRHPRTQSRGITTRGHDHSSAVKLYSLLMFAYGCGVFIVTLTAGHFLHQMTLDPSSCVDRIYPWLSSTDASIIRRINCTALDIAGTEDEVATAIDKIDPRYTVKLEFRNCPRLQVPPSLQRFRQVTAIIFFNVTLMDWPESAAITRQAFSSLIKVQMRLVTIACVPYGLFVQPLPLTIERLAFRTVKGLDFFALVNDSWRDVLYFTCQDCGFTRIPPIVQNMPLLDQLSLDGNAIATVARSDFAPHNVLTSLGLSDNPVTSLPDDVWAMGCNSLTSVYMQRTGISNISFALAEACSNPDPGIVLLANGSPVCTTAPPSWLTPFLYCDSV